MMRKKILNFNLVILTFLTLSCQKKTNENAPKNSFEKINGEALMTTPSTCDGYYPLGWTDTTMQELKGNWKGITIIVNSPYYKMYCDDGSIIQPVNGLPFFGSLAIVPSENTSIWLFPTGPTSGNQFVIVQGGWPSGAESTLSKYINQFRIAYQLYQNNPSTTIPQIDSYVKPIGGVKIVTGKLIRVSTGTKFGVAPACHPDPSFNICNLM